MYEARASLGGAHTRVPATGPRPGPGQADQQPVLDAIFRLGQQMAHRD